MRNRIPPSRMLFSPGETAGSELIDDVALVAAIGDAESAWLDAQAAVGLIAEEIRAEAADGIAAVVRLCSDSASELRDLSSAAESGGNPIIPFLARVRQGLSPQASRAIHRGLTSQDAMDTAMTVLIARAMTATDAGLDEACRILARLSKEHASTVCLARTLTQPALPTTFGLRAANWAATLNEVVRAAPATATVQIGGAAGTRAAIREFAGDRADGLVAAFISRIHPPTTAYDDFVPWHTNRTRIVVWATHFAQCIAACATIARDVLIGTRPEIGELVLGSTGGSSAMPHKHNPTAAVLLHRNGLRAPAALATIAAAAADAVEERSDGAWHAEWPALAELIALAASSASILTEMLRGLAADPAAMQHNLDAAGIGVMSERLSVRFGDRLTKAQIGEVVAAGTAPAAASALDALLGPGDYAGLFDPSDYLGDAETIRRRILAALDQKAN